MSQEVRPLSKGKQGTGDPVPCPRGCGRVILAIPMQRHVKTCFYPVTIERLLEIGKVTPAGPDECWVWKGRLKGGKKGRYGLTSRGVASRVALEIALGRPLRDGYEACHTCDVQACVNPAHLYEGTHRQNMHDYFTRQRNPLTEPEVRAKIVASRKRKK